MTDGADRGPRRLRRWVALRLPLMLLAAVLVPPNLNAIASLIVGRAANPHSFFKASVECWQMLLLHRGALPWVVLAGAPSGLVLALLRGAAWRRAALAVAALVVLLPPARWIPALVPLLALGLAGVAPWPVGERGRRGLLRLLWVPGVELLWPAPAFRLLVGERPRGVAIALAAGGAAALAAAGVVLGTVASYRPGVHDLEYAWWPDGLVDPRVVVVDRSREGVTGDYHEIQVVGDRAVVAAEGTGRVLSVPLDGGAVQQTSVPPRRMRHGQIGSVSAYTDPDSGTTWMMTAFDQLGGFRVEQAGWRQIEQIDLQAHLQFVYCRWASGIDRLLLVEVSGLNATAGQMVAVDLQHRRPAEHVYFHTAGGERFPSPRDAAWIPPLGKLAIAPDYGRSLHLVDPTTGFVEPWLETDTINGRMVWVPRWQRLVLAKPNDSEIWIVDPDGPVVERRIETHKGVRVMDVDAENGLIVTASMLTGTVQVQRVDDGAVVDRFGTVMPMVRNLALSPDTGQAVLSTWTVLYRIPYLDALR